MYEREKIKTNQVEWNLLMLNVFLVSLDLGYSCPYVQKMGI